MFKRERSKARGRKVRRREPRPRCGKSEKGRFADKSLQPDKAAHDEDPCHRERHFFDGQFRSRERASQKGATQCNCQQNRNRKKGNAGHFVILQAERYRSKAHVHAEWRRRAGLDGQQPPRSSDRKPPRSGITPLGASRSAAPRSAMHALRCRGRMGRGPFERCNVDALLDPRGRSWWDAFYSNRSKPCPFFVPYPDESLAQWFDEGLIHPGQAIDIGCGNGRNAIFLARHGFSVEAVDVSETAIEWARERAAQADVVVTLMQASVFAIDLRLAKYDLVCDSGCYHHIPPHRRMQYVGLIHDGSSLRARRFGRLRGRLSHE